MAIERTGDAKSWFEMGHMGHIMTVRMDNETITLSDGSVVTIADIIGYFSKVIQLLPNDAESYFLRGDCYLYLKQNGNAIADFKKAADLGYSDALQKLAGLGVQYTPGSGGSSSSGDSSSSRKTLTYLEAFKLNAQVMMSVQYKDWDMAIRLLTEGIDNGIEPQHKGSIPLLASFYTMRGGCYEQKGNMEQAIADWKRSLDINPDPESEILEKLAALGVQYTPKGSKQQQQSTSSSSSSGGYSDKNQGVLIVLSILLGFLGVDRFYIGRWGLGILKIVTLPVGVGIIWYLIDIVLAITGKMEDSYGCEVDSTDNKAAPWIVLVILLVVMGFGASKIVSAISKPKTAATQTVLTTTTTQDVNLREFPLATSTLIKTLKQGTTVTITGNEQDGWTPVSHGGDTGWISSQYLSTATQTTTSNSGTAASSTTTQTQTTPPAEEEVTGPRFPAEFVGTWKRENPTGDDTLTLTEKTFKWSTFSFMTYEVTEVSGDVYTLLNNGAASSPWPYTMKMVDGKLEVSDTYYHTWDGTWTKQ